MMQVAQLEELATRLRHLKFQLDKLSGSPDQPLSENSEFVQAAQECDFMLPTPLTMRTLSETVDRKLENVAVLTERARKHESLPEEAQIAAEQEYMMSDEDYALTQSQQSADANEKRVAGSGSQ